MGNIFTYTYNYNGSIYNIWNFLSLRSLKMVKKGIKILCHNGSSIPWNVLNQISQIARKVSYTENKRKAKDLTDC